MYYPIPVGLTSGVIVGRVVAVTPHPNAHKIRLAQVDLGTGQPVQIVFGGPPNVHEGDLVPVAPPGSRIPGRDKMQKMRRRRYRGESSYGMLCSLAELGWNPDAPNEVALLRDVKPGDSLDKISPKDRQELVINSTSMDNANLGQDAKVLPSDISPEIITKDCHAEIRADQSNESQQTVWAPAIIILSNDADHLMPINATPRNT